METTKHAIEAHTHGRTSVVRCADGCIVGVARHSDEHTRDDADPLHEGVGTTGSKDYRAHRYTHAHADMLAPQASSSRTASVVRKVVCASMLGGGCAAHGD
jgi:hypothetical protein